MNKRTHILYLLTLCTAISLPLEAVDWRTWLANMYHRHYSSRPTAFKILAPATLIGLCAAAYYKHMINQQLAKKINLGQDKATQSGQLTSQKKEPTAKELLLLEAIRQSEEAKKRVEEADRALQESKRQVQEFEARREREQIQHEQERQKERDAYNQLVKAEQEKIAPTIAHLKQYQENQHNRLFGTINNSSLTILYNLLDNPLGLQMSQEMLENNKDNLPLLFTENGLIPSGEFKRPAVWSEYTWQKALQILTERVEHPLDEREGLYLDQIPVLLRDAKNILKSCLPPDNFSFSEEQTVGCYDLKYNLRLNTPQKHFVSKFNAINRIITYMKLKKVIQDQQLTHISLPLKFLVIKNDDTKQYITDRQAMEDILEKYIAINVSLPSHDLLCTGPGLIDDRNNKYGLKNNYTFYVFAQKVHDTERAFNANAFNQLERLVQEVPFDVGYRNIFSDAKRDVIIIDTENKGEQADTAILKLQERYRHDEESKKNE